MLESEVEELLYSKESRKRDQISREIEAFFENYQNLEPKYLIIYDRVAYYQDNGDLRITIDMNPRYRTNDLNLHTSMEGIPLLDDGGAILEIKVQHSIPLWLAAILSEGKIYQTSFSKVGTAHKLELAKKQRTNIISMVKEPVKGVRYGFTI